MTRKTHSPTNKHIEFLKDANNSYIVKNASLAAKCHHKIQLHHHLWVSNSVQQNCLLINSKG